MVTSRLFLFIVTMFTSSSVCLAQVENSKLTIQEDSLLQLLDDTESDSMKMTIYNKLRRITIYDNPLNALKYTKSYGEIASRLDNKRNYYISKIYEGHCLLPLGEHDEALEAYSLAESYFADQKDSTLIASIYNSIGAVYEQSGRDSLAEKYFEQSYNISIEINDTSRQALALNNLSNILFRRKNFLASKENLEKIFNFRRELFSDDTYQKYLLNYANTLWELNDLKKAKSTFIWLLGEKDVDNFTQIRSYTGLGEIASSENKTWNAIQFYRNAYDISVENNFELETVEIALILTKLHAKIGQFEEAYEMYQVHYEINDRLQRIEKDKIFEVALVKYETAKKESNIALLEAGNILKDYQIKQANFWKWVFISGIAALIVLAILLYRLQKIKSITNKKLEDKNLIISKSLEEKEILLREVHHRVKNNLQMITSLLNLQAKSVDDPGVAQAITDSKNRIHSIALLHQKLYQSTDVSNIDIAHYFDNILEHILSANKTQDKHIVLQKNIENLNFDIDKSILLGIILNELVTNALKHGFVENEPNHIKIDFHEIDGRVNFSVKDNGKGVIDELSYEKKGRFGLKLIRILAESLDANIKINTDNGTQIALSFFK